MERLAWAGSGRIGFSFEGSGFFVGGGGDKEVGSGLFTVVCCGGNDITGLG